MRALLIVHGFPPSGCGGSEIHAHDHAKRMQRLGDDVAVLTREQDPSRPEYAVRHEQRDGLRIAWVNNTFRETSSFEETYHNPAIGAVADRLIEEYAPEVAYIHHLTCLSTSIVTSLAARGVPTVFTLHDYWLMCHRGQLLDTAYRLCEGPTAAVCRRCLDPSVGLARVPGSRAARDLLRHLPIGWQGQIRRTAGALDAVWTGGAPVTDQAQKRLDHMRRIAGQVTQFVAPSDSVRERFVAFGIPPERIVVSRNGLDHTPYRHLTRRNTSHLRIGFLGSLMVSKAPHVLLEAFGRLPAGTATLDLFGAYAPYHGDDSYRAALKPLLEQPGVTMRGPIAHQAVAAELASIDLLVVPSIWPETSSLVIQEAFLAGTPVVASRIGAIPEVIKDGQGGLLFNPGNVDELARLLARLVDERDLLPNLRAGIPSVPRIEDNVRTVRALVTARRRPATKTAAVVLNYRTPHDTLLAVRSLAASESPIADIIVVDNDTTADGDLPGLVGRDATVLHAGANLGFSGGVNVGIRNALDAGADRILLINSDVIMPPDCLTFLEGALAVSPSAGIAGPVVLSRSYPDVVASRGITYSAITGRMRHLGTGTRITTDPGPPVSPADAVAGCVMLITRAAFTAVGLFDEDYFYAFEDLDFCLRARRAGFETVVANLALAYHEGGRSIGAASCGRLYFAARNHLRLARKLAPPGRVSSAGRTAWIVALNIAHALRGGGGTRRARLRAVVRGVHDYRTGRFGAGSEAGRLSNIAQLG